MRDRTGEVQVEDKKVADVFADFHESLFASSAVTEISDTLVGKELWPPITLEDIK